MNNFPKELKHDSGVIMSLDKTRLLIKYKEPPESGVSENILRNVGLVLENKYDNDDNKDNKEERKIIIRRSLKVVNQTKNRFWVHNQNDKPISQNQFKLIKEKMADWIDWIGPVYRLGNTKEGKGFLCPLPNVLLIKPVKEKSRELLSETLSNYGLKEVPEKSKYLGEYRYYMLSDQEKGTVFSLKNIILKKESELVSEVHFENMPLINPLTYISHDPLFPQQWNMIQIQAGGDGRTGWDISKGDKNIVICILDTGCYLNHPDLSFYNNGINLGDMKTTGSPTGQNKGIPGTEDFECVRCHGTRCAGIAAAHIDYIDSSGVLQAKGIAGMAGKCQILPVAFENFTDAEAAAGIRYAADNGARIISMSLGVYGPEDDHDPAGWDFKIIDPAISYAVDTKGCIFCAAAGNDDNGSLLCYPARNPKVIACGASDPDDMRKSPNSPDGWGSNFGPGISVVAPGEQIPTTDFRADTNEDNLLSFNGTSAATPHVAGLAALILSIHPKLSNETVRYIIETTADKVGDYVYSEDSLYNHSTWNQEMGYGRINVLNALECAQNLYSPPPYVENVEVLSCGRKYYARWVDKDNFTRRELEEVISEPIIPGLDEVEVIVFFHTSSHGGASGLARGMKDVKLTLVGKDTNNQDINILMQQFGGCEFRGKFKPKNLGRNYLLTLQIEGSDDSNRFDMRNPKGDVIDSNPATIATADLNSPPLYPFLNYEPGIDSNHKIWIGTLAEELPPDQLINNDFSTATYVNLPMPTNCLPVSINYNDLNLHNSTDKDYFDVEFQSDILDDSYQADGPITTVISKYLGLSVIRYPPFFSIKIFPENCNQVDIYIYKSDNYAKQLIQINSMVSHFSTYNPIRLFGDKRFYIRITNTDYKSQGAFKYGIIFIYGPRSVFLIIDRNAPAYRARPTIMRRYLKRYYDHIDLPRPSDELANTIKEKGLPLGSQPFIINNMDSFIKNCENFFSQSQTHEDLNKVTESKNQTRVIVAEVLNNLGDLAYQAGLKNDAERLFQKSSEMFSKLEKDNKQLADLEELNKLIKDKINRLEVR